MRPHAFGLAIAMGLLACAGLGVRDAELPERPILLSYYDAATHRRRIEAREDQQKGPAPSTPGQAVAQLDDVAGYLGNLLGARKDERSLERRFPGRLASLAPRTRAVELVEAARPSAIPRALSPDGRRLLFTQAVDDRRQLYELDLETEEVRPVTRARGVHPDGCYGPGGRLALVRAQLERGHPVSHIYLTTPGGVRPQRISEGPNDFAVACAPDGSAVVWVSHDGRGRMLLMSRMPPVEGEIRLLGPGRDPSFSPDGEWVVYSARVGERWQLHRIRADGTGRKRIGQSVLDEIQPSISPDGRLVVYVADDGMRKMLFLRRFDGTGERVLLESGAGLNPVW